MLSRRYWVTRDKRRIAIQDMETQHLYNTIAMLIRHAKKKHYDSVMFHADLLESHGTLGVHEKLFDLLNRTYEDFLPGIYYDLVAEYITRLSSAALSLESPKLEGREHSG